MECVLAGLTYEQCLIYCTWMILLFSAPHLMNICNDSQMSFMLYVVHVYSQMFLHAEKVLYLDPRQAEYSHLIGY